MGPCKALGMMDFSILSIKSCVVIKDGFIYMVQKLFRFGNLLAGLNHTFVVFILKYPTYQISIT